MRRVYLGRDITHHSLATRRAVYGDSRPQTQAKVHRDGAGVHGDNRRAEGEGVVEATNQPAQGVEFYIPHKPVIREGGVN